MEENKNKKQTSGLNFDFFFNTGIGILLFIVLALHFITFVRDLKNTTATIKENENKVVTNKAYLESLSYGGNELSGNWILGSGYISGKQYYVAYEILEDGGKKLLKIPADETIIYDTLESNENAYLEIDKNGNGTVKARRLYVPTGTITKEYSLSF